MPTHFTPSCAFASAACIRERSLHVECADFTFSAFAMWRIVSRAVSLVSLAALFLSFSFTLSLLSRFLSFSLLQTIALFIVKTES
jgi:hypothetical protein